MPEHILQSEIITVWTSSHEKESVMPGELVQVL